MKTDIAIIGAGAAGITLARELIGDSRGVMLIESGGFDLDADTQALYEGEASVDSGGVDYPLDAARLRYFRGQHQSLGRLPPAAGRDRFREARLGAAFRLADQPRADLDPYYACAAVCQLGRDLDVRDFDRHGRVGETAIERAAPFVDNAFVTRFFIYSAPLRFGDAYRDAIGKAPNIATYLNSNVTEIVPAPIPAGSSACA